VSSHRRTLIRIAAAGAAALAATAVTIGVALSGTPPETGALIAIGRGLMVAVPIAVGLWAWRHGEPDERFGKLLVATGFAWFLTTLAESQSSVLYSTGRVAGWITEVGLVYLFLAFPSGRLLRPIDRRLVWAAGLLVATLYVPSALLTEHFPVPSAYTSCTSGCPSNAFLLGSEPAFIDGVVRPLREVLTTLLFLAVTARLIQRWRGASDLSRRALGPVVGVAAFRCATLPVALIARAAIPDTQLDVAFSWVLALAVPAVAVAFFAGLTAWRLYCVGALERLGASVKPGLMPPELRDKLRQAIGDPSLRLFRLMGAQDKQWLDEYGNAQLPVAARGQTLSTVFEDEATVAVMAHDAALDHDPHFLDAVTALIVMSLDNEELAATVDSSLLEIRRSRARIVAVADEERRRIERNLHDGAQQRLVALRVQLELAQELIQRDQRRGLEKLRTLGTEVDEALEEIRALARGVYPPLLAESGLADALAAAARKLPMPASVEMDGAAARYPSDVESAVYFCCLEAMQNASKHADGAKHVFVALQRDGDLSFEVRDDGAGYDPAAGRNGGGGMTNMHDRIAAVGGELTVTSEPGLGTRVTGRVPLG
jgi:signal transduction histidine kinase